MSRPVEIPTTVAAVRQETPIDRTFVLPVPPEQREAFAFTPGQFVVVRDPAEEPGRRRAYSISSPPGPGDALELTVRDMGAFGHVFYSFEVGKPLLMRPPAGRFVLQTNPGEALLLIAGGSGVTPFRSFLGHLDAQDDPTRVTLLQSAQQPEELPFVEAFTAWAARDAVTYVPTVTRAAAGHPWSGRRGRIDRDLIAAHMPDPERTRVYACGPAAFVKAMLAEVTALGVPAAQQHKEQWG